MCGRYALYGPVSRLREAFDGGKLGSALGVPAADQSAAEATPAGGA